MEEVRASSPTEKNPPSLTTIRHWIIDWTVQIYREYYLNVIPVESRKWMVALSHQSISLVEDILLKELDTRMSFDDLQILSFCCLFTCGN